jgi:hypothetical protein
MTSHPALGHVAWENYSHQSLWDMVDAADPHAVMDRSTDLSTLAATMGDDTEHVRALLQRLLSTWDGPAADQTAAAVRPVLDWAAHAATTASEIASRLGQYAEAINTAREDMPAPVDYQQVDAAAAGGTVSLSGDLDLRRSELTAMAHGHTATAAQADAKKTEAVKVMRHYEHASAAAYHGLPTFPKPPKMAGLPTTTPASEPPPVVTPEPPVLSPPVGPVNPHDPAGLGENPVPGVQQSGSTTLSGFAGPVGPGAGGVIGGQGGIGGIGGGIGTAGLPGLSGAVAGAGPASAAASPVGAFAADTEAQLGRMAGAEAAAEGEGGWTGFGPMGQGGGRGFDRDGEHRDRYAGKPDLFGELPAAYPPVLGL